MYNKSNSTQEKFDAYQMVTDKICALLESGLIPWVKPWSSAVNGAWSRSTGSMYSLLNQWLLADPNKKYKTMDEILNDVSGEWLTFEQAQQLGGHVKKGEKGRKVVFFKIWEKETDELDDDGNKKVKKFPVLRAYTVFKISQCEGIEQKHHTNTETTYTFTADQTADEILNNYVNREGITLSIVKGDRAYYSPVLDTIVLPKQEQFKNSKEWYSTAFHEATHSTGHESRLNRFNDSKVAAFGDESYSTEELVAEIGSASILATLGIDTEGTLRNSAAYIQSWLKALKNDKKMIVVAASRAEKAIRRILNIKED